MAIGSVVRFMHAALAFVLVCNCNVASMAQVITPPISFSAGFSSDAVLQRSPTDGVRVYGFTTTMTTNPVVTVLNTATSDSYSVHADVTPWTSTSGCNATNCIDPRTPLPPAHGNFTWVAMLKPQPTAGGDYTITVTIGNGVNDTIVLERVTYGDVYFCSGQSNMALQTFFTFSAETIRADVAAGKYGGLRHFMYGSMSDHFESLAPQYVVSWNSVSADPSYKWHNVTSSAAEPSRLPGSQNLHSAWAQFSATCMYFGVELIDARASQGLESIPIGLIQSAIGGSQIESWMDNETLTLCKNQSLSGGAIPEDSGRLYYGMTAPFVNYTIAGWLWYQGENNCGGVMGNSIDGIGYGCSLPAMINSWRTIWNGDERRERLFGVATLAAGGSEGAGQHMAGMRWSQTANYGYWPNPAMPNVFGAQVYDIGDPWAQASDGNQPVENKTTGKPIQPETLGCCFQANKAFNITGDPGCGNKTSTNPNLRRACYDMFQCALPDPVTGKYGKWCVPFDESAWPKAMQPLVELVKENDPSGFPGINFMGGIHPRLKRPVGRRLAFAAVRLLKQQQAQQLGLARDTSDELAMTGPTISGCTYTSSNAEFELTFNKTMLGSESLLLNEFDNNKTGGWGVPQGGLDKPITDSSGAMVCTVDPLCNTSDPRVTCGNETTCQCQSWDYLKVGFCNSTSCHMYSYWYCEVGPGWKPSTQDIMIEKQRRKSEQTAPTPFSTASESSPQAETETETAENMLGWVPSTCPFYSQWHPAPLKLSDDGASVTVDMSVAGLKGLTPIAIRYAWPMFRKGDTCCPTASIQGGRGVCIPGKCPLYSNVSALPANPFFAVVTSGKCRCQAPQVCSA